MNVSLPGWPAGDRNRQPKQAKSGVPCFVGRGRDVIFSMRYSYACEVAFLRERRGTRPTGTNSRTLDRIDPLLGLTPLVSSACEPHGGSDLAIWRDDSDRKRKVAPPGRGSGVSCFNRGS
jgi:hypothetical protein